MKKSLIFLLLILLIAWLIAIWREPSPNRLGQLLEKLPNEQAEPVLTHPLITITAPQPGELVTSPFLVTGEARGSWFFEATFPVTLTDAAGEVMVETFATALGDWMTEDFVPFSLDLEFPPPVDPSRAQLIFHKANPSGLDEQADSYVREIYLNK